MNKYAILICNYGIYVKEYGFFVEQGGLTQSWAKNWMIIESDSIENARKYGVSIRDTMKEVMEFEYWFTRLSDLPPRSY